MLIYYKSCLSGSRVVVVTSDDIGATAFGWH